MGGLTAGIRTSPMGRIDPAIDAAVNAGIAKFNAGRTAASLADFTAAIRLDPSNACARMLRAHALRAQDKTAEAERDVLAAVRFDARSAALRLTAAGFLKDIGKPEAALVQCGAAIRLEPGSAGAHEARSRLLFTLGRYGPALESIRRAVEIEPRSAAHRRLAAELLKNLGKTRAALEECRRALRLDACSWDCLELRARLESVLGLPGAAAKTIARAIALEPRRAKLRLMAAHLLKDLGKTAEAAEQCRLAISMESGLWEAHMLLSDLESALGRTAEAWESLSAALKLKPDSDGLHLRAARLLKDLSRPADALNHCRRALALRASPGECHEMVGLLEAALGRPEAAWASIAKAIRLQPRSASLRLNAAHLLKESGKLESALEQCRAAVRLGERSARGYRLLADIQAGLGKNAGALGALGEAVAIEPGSAALRLRAAELLKDLSRYEEGLKQCGAALRLQPDSIEARRLKCGLQLAYGLGGEALETLRETVARSGGASEIRFWAAGVHRRLGYFQEAYADLKETLRLDPRRIDALLALGELELWHGEYAAAEKIAVRAVSEDGSSSAARTLRGAAVLLRGRPRESARHLNKAVALAPDGREPYLWRAEARRKLGLLAAAEADIEKALHELPAWDRPLGGLINRALIRLARGGSPPRKDLEAIFMGAAWRQVGLAWTEPPSVETMESLLSRMQGNRTATPTFLWAGEPGSGRRRRIHYLTRSLLIELQGKVRFGNAGRVLKEFDRLIQEEPGEPYLHASRGEVCLWVGRYGEARKNILRARALNPKLPWPNIGLCGVYAMRREYRKALQHLELAAGNGASAFAMNTWRGEIYRKLGDNERALQSLGKTLHPPPFRLAQWLNLALAKGAAGDKRGEREIFARLKKHVGGFLSDAARATGEARPGTARILEKALELMRGNRSSWLYAWVSPSGEVKHVKIRGVRPDQAPSAFVNNPWMFEGFEGQNDALPGVRG